MIENNLSNKIVFAKNKNDLWWPAIVNFFNIKIRFKIKHKIPKFKLIYMKFPILENKIQKGK
jgi:hypothetical protein